jgi:hypothetical protein
MIRLNQTPGDYSLRFATYPTGDMQQVLEGQAIVSYSVRSDPARQLSLDGVLTVCKNSTAMGTLMGVQDDPASVWMFINGSAIGGAATLDPSLLSPFDGNAPLRKMADLTKFFSISQTGIVTWVVDRYPYTESTIPILFGNSSDGWLANTTIQMPFNSTIDIVMTIANDSMDTVSFSIYPDPV